MTPISGVQAGRYELLDRIGAGGMGEVYRARDRRLDRIVALKALPSAVADDPARRARFEREARTIASLTHPHICGLHDVVWQDGREWLVLEHLEGETLEERLRSGPLPLDDVLRLGAQLAGALEEAHRAGIVHRDLKPSNVMLTASGVKLLDFGIAKLTESGAPGTEARSTASLTAERHILGTIRYMAPEQLEGRRVDAQTDVFALGAVLYKMATGSDAFGGDSTASQIAAVLTADPAPLAGAARGELMPAALDHVVRRCLAKQPDARWQTARDVKTELEWIANRLPARSTRLRRVLIWMAVGVVTTGAFAGLSARRPRDLARPVDAPIAIAIPAPPGTHLLPGVLSMALSPDGRHVAFLAAERDQGDTLLWIRDLDSTVARVLPGTDRAMRPFWSGDSRYVAFFVGNTLKKVPVDGGPLETICETPRDGPGGWPGAWNREGTILFSPRDHDSLWQVQAAGGTPTPATRLDRARGDQWNGHPQFLPDGRHFLYDIGNRDVGRQTVSIGVLGSFEPTHLFAATTSALYAPPGYLLFVQGVTLMARPFDVDHLRATGDPMTIATDVILNRAVNKGLFSVSETGVLAFRTFPPRRIAWYDRQGHLLNTVGAAGSATDPTLSHDGRRLAVTRRDPGSANSDIWTCDVGSSTCAALTSNPSLDAAPLFSSDDRRILYSSDRGGVYGIYRRSLEPDGADDLVRSYNRVLATWLYSLLPDNRHAVVDGAPGDATTADVVVVDLEGESAAQPLFRTRAEGSGVRISPDGRYIAYSGKVGGRFEVFVRAFPDGRDVVRVSTSGGVEPHWRADGRELYYLAPDRRLMSVAFRDSSPPEAQAPVPLFPTECDTSSTGSFLPSGRNQYDVTPDGQRFVVSEVASESPITVIVNWPALLKR